RQRIGRNGPRRSRRIARHAFYRQRLISRPGRGRYGLPAKRKCREAAMELRYLGFDQKQNTRTYKFDGVANGHPTVHFAVTADLALFLANRIGIQEGPTLCAHKLSATPETATDTNLELTNDDLRAHASARSMAEARKAEARRMGPRRRPPVPPSRTGRQRERGYVAFAGYGGFFFSPGSV